MSANGDVTAEIVYTNYGSWEDHEWLKSQGVNVTGKICLAKYGGILRGLIVRHCELNGGIGTIIYSDPADDGPVGKENGTAKAYPDGPYRNKDSVQRGTVANFALAQGDATTPGIPATPDADRIPLENNPSLPGIPSLPISWAQAEPLLKALVGHGINTDNVKVNDNDWKGGLNISYWTGPSTAKVNLVNRGEYKIMQIYDVIARIEGTHEPDKLVIIGTHRDTWGFGGVDPHSGSATLLEAARSFGELLKKGWKPRRSILLASWDAEEYGIVGSTEWVEGHKEMLNNAVAYLNMDPAVFGKKFRASGVPTLHDLIRRIAKKVPDPATGKTVSEASDFENSTIGDLGSGSDYGPFLDFLGIPCVDLKFAGPYGVYHSNYDSFHWMEKFGDPNFEYMPTMAKIIGLMAVELADAEILPFNVANYPPALLRYVTNLEKLIAKYGGNQTQPVLDLTPLRDAIYQFSNAVTALAKDVAQLQQESAQSKGGKSFDWDKRTQSVNSRLMKIERAFIDPEGLPKRPLFKHQIYAPGIRYGYGVQYYPAIADAVEEKDWKQAAKARDRIVKLLKNACVKIATV
ncbi:uncharacterized protein VTP21DRAFT_4838 [Calcarisporiella thermophila]|uniref:uncharacterized protein n=1 Tax=Calcarisporiella thermophila TaxID=911321 RepID=UPI003743368F